MHILVSPDLLNMAALDMMVELKRIFDQARQDQKGNLFGAFAAIAAHLVNPETDIREALAAVGLNEPPSELSKFFQDGSLLHDAKTALKTLTITDNTDPNSWGSFMEFAREQFGK